MLLYKSDERKVAVSVVLVEKRLVLRTVQHILESFQREPVLFQTVGNLDPVKVGIQVCMLLEIVLEEYFV